MIFDSQDVGTANEELSAIRFLKLRNKEDLNF